MSEQEADAARYEIQQYYDDGLISYLEYDTAIEAIEDELRE